MNATVKELSKDKLYSFVLADDGGVLREGHVHFDPDTSLVRVTYRDGQPNTDSADMAVMDAFLRLREGV